MLSASLVIRLSPQFQREGPNARLMIDSAAHLFIAPLLMASFAFATFGPAPAPLIRGGTFIDSDQPKALTSWSGGYARLRNLRRHAADWPNRCGKRRKPVVMQVEEVAQFCQIAHTLWQRGQLVVARSGCASASVGPVVQIPPSVR